MSIIKNYIAGTATKLNQLKYLGNGPIITNRIPTTIDDNGPRANELTARGDDLKRFTKLFTRPEGIKHLANEAKLKKVNQDNSAKYRDKTLAGRILASVKDGLFDSGKIIATTLAQVPVNGTGTHFIRGFRSYQNPYLGRPAESYGGFLGGIFSNKENIKGGTISTKNVETNLAKQAIKDPEKDIRSGAESEFNSVRPVDNSQIDVENQAGSVSTFFGNTLSDITSTIDVKFGLSRALNGFKNSLLTNYSKQPLSIQVDKLNILGPQSTAPNTSYKSLGSTKDIIKFNFQIITPGEDANNPVTTTLYFRALLDDFQDSYSSNWNEQQYVGRGEKFHVYGGFDREINLGFKIAAMTRAEMKPLYQKIVQLASTTAPTYSTGGFMRGTLVKVTVGDYLYETPGYIGSVDYSWDQSYPWEIKYKDNSEPVGVDEDVQQLPMVLNVSVRFKPIHDFVPETGLRHFITNPVEDPFFDPPGFVDSGEQSADGLSFTGQSEAVSNLIGIGSVKPDMSGLEDLAAERNRELAIARLSAGERRKLNRRQKRLQRRLKNGRISGAQYLEQSRKLFNV